MKQIPYRKLYYHISHRYFTLNTLVIVVAFLIAASWTWGAIGVMQRNYALQQSIARKEQQLLLTELETKTQEFENKYYQSDEYKELEVRRSLGYGIPGEKVIILPTYPEQERPQSSGSRIDATVQPSNFEQWMNFLFGGRSRA